MPVSLMRPNRSISAIIHKACDVAFGIDELNYFVQIIVWEISYNSKPVSFSDWYSVVSFHKLQFY